MKKYNYFDDDADDILDEIRARVKESEAEQAEHSHDRGEVLDAIKAFSLRSGDRIVTAARSALTRNPLEELDRLARNKKRAVTLTLVFVFFLFLATMVAVTVHSVETENKRIAQFDAAAGKVCAQYISKYGNCNYENLYNSYGVQGNRMTGLCYAREMDFDNDNRSELLLAYMDGGVYYTEVYGYDGKKFVSLFKEKAAQSKSVKEDAWVTVYAKNNRYFIGVHDGKDLSKVGLYGLRGETFEKRYSCTYDKDAEAFSFKGKVDAMSFERIKLAVLREEKAAVTVDLVTKTMEGFSSEYIKAAQNADSAQSMNTAYYSVVEELNAKYGKAKYVKDNGVAFINGLAVVDLIDFDGDGTDELLVIYRKSVVSRSEDRYGQYISQTEDKYYLEIYRYNGMKALLAYKGEGISNALENDTDMYYIIKKKNGKNYYCHNAFSSSNYGRVVNASSSVMKLNGTTFEAQFKAAYHTDYGYTEYYIDDREVYRSTFKEKGYQVPLFDGEDDYDASIFSVVYLQRKLLKAEDMESVVAKTQSNIRKLNASYASDN